MKNHKAHQMQSKLVAKAGHGLAKTVETPAKTDKKDSKNVKRPLENDKLKQRANEANTKAPKPFKCDRCNRGFSYRKTLQVHICLFEKVVVVRKHEQVFHRKCLICGHIAGSESSIKNHIKQFHRHSSIVLSSKLNERAISGTIENGEKEDLSEETSSSVVSESTSGATEDKRSQENGFEDREIAYISEVDLEETNKELPTQKLEGHHGTIISDSRRDTDVTKSSSKALIQKSKIYCCKLCGIQYTSILKLSKHFTANHIKTYETSIQYNTVKKKHYKVFKCLLCNREARNPKHHIKKHSKDQVQRFKKPLLKKMLREEVQCFAEDSSTETADSGSDVGGGRSESNEQPQSLEDDSHHGLPSAARHISSELTSSKDEGQRLHNVAKMPMKDGDICRPNIVNSSSKIYHCSICGKSFVSHDHLKDHLLSHATSNHQFHCRYCRVSFEKSHDLFRHEITHRSEADLYKCLNCGSCFRNRLLFDGHRVNCFTQQMETEEQSGNYVQIDADQGNSQSESETHAEAVGDDIYENIEHSSLVDALRNADLIQSDSMEQEVSPQQADTLSQKEGTGEFPCFRCPKVFSTSSRLKFHLLSHTESVKFRCHFRDTPFKTSSDLVRHEKGHENELKPYRCRLCGSRFAYLAHLHYHKSKCLESHNGTIMPVDSEFKADCGKENLPKNNLVAAVSVSVASDAKFIVKDIKTSPGTSPANKFDITDIKIMDVRGGQYQYRSNTHGQLRTEQKLSSPLEADEASNKHNAHYPNSSVLQQRLHHQSQLPSQVKFEHDGPGYHQKIFDTLCTNTAREEYAELMKAKPSDSKYNGGSYQNGIEIIPSPPQAVQSRSPNYTLTQPAQLTSYAGIDRHVVKDMSPSSQQPEMRQNVNHPHNASEALSRFFRAKSPPPYAPSPLSHSIDRTRVTQAISSTQPIEVDGAKPSQVINSDQSPRIETSSCQATFVTEKPRTPLPTSNVIQFSQTSLLSPAAAVTPNFQMPIASGIPFQANRLATPFLVPQLQASTQFARAAYPGTVLFYPVIPAGSPPNILQHKMYEQYMHAMNPRLQSAQTQSIDLGQYQPYLTSPVGRQVMNKGSETHQSPQFYNSVPDTSAFVNAAVLQAQQMHCKDPNVAIHMAAAVHNVFPSTNCMPEGKNSMNINANDHGNGNGASTVQIPSQQVISPDGNKGSTLQYMPPHAEFVLQKPVLQTKERIKSPNENTLKVSQNGPRPFRYNPMKRPSMALESPQVLTKHVGENILPPPEASSGVAVQQDKSSETEGEDKIYQCSICNKIFSRYLNFSRHQFMHAVNPPYECKLCGKNYTQKSFLEAHMHTHEGELPQECGFCGKRFLNKPLLAIHKLETHAFGNQ